MSAHDCIVEDAPAKVNLSLDVLGVRPDGYHELRSVMQTISLRDRLWLRLGPESGLGREDREGWTTVSASSDATGENDRQAGYDLSLIDRAMQAVLQEARSPAVMSYRVEKNIPGAAGLGGGSSDAVAAIRGTSRLLGVQLSDAVQLAMASRLGSDVPFFLAGGTALVEGRGERITALAPMPDTHFLLLPGPPVSTKTVFEALGPGDIGAGKATSRVLEALKGSRVVAGGNDLTRPAIRCYPWIEESLALLASVAPADRVAMTGSGGTVMALFATEAEATKAREGLRDRAPQALLARSVETR